MGTDLDPRRHPFREDLAGEYLRGSVKAERFAKADPMQVCVSVAPLKSSPEATSLASELIYGEVFDVYEVLEDWVWGQNQRDGYVGYVPKGSLRKVIPATHQVATRFAQVYEAPHFKSTPVMSIPFLSPVSATDVVDGFLKTKDGFICEKHMQMPKRSFVETARLFLGTPYLWGGRSTLGLDCSALVQLSLGALGQDCPRDSDMQMADLGEDVGSGGPYEEGDLLFWKGHVAIVLDANTLIHANAFHMRVEIESISGAISRIAKSDGLVTAHKRMADVNS